MSAVPRPVAFFDVDETLLTGKSMIEFLRHRIVRDGGSESEVQEVLARLSPAIARPDRTAANRAYYRRLAGVEAAELTDAGRRWYAVHRERPGAFVTSTKRALAGHRAAGHLVALVSGSCPALLEPLADDVGAEEVLCTQPTVGRDGRLTGDVDRPMIGPAKATAVSELLRARSVDPSNCFAYGDHASDLDMLEVVGAPRVVGGDPVLTRHARWHGWPVLPA